MLPKSFHRIPILMLLASCASLSALELSDMDASAIGQKIWMNECNQTIEGLLSWNQGEEFPSLGIGHFIWYPIGKKGIFAETFPDLVQFLKDHNAPLPYWLTPKTTCPWHTRAEFEKEKRSFKMRDLHKFLTRTISLQALYMAQRFETIQTRLYKELTASDEEHVKTQIERISKHPNGAYVLLDYLNFKGDGTNIQERYQDRGWGLLQVLLKMPGNTENPIDEFVSSAKKLLSDRVELAPPQRNESRWLKGWHNRLDTYRQ